VNSQLLRKFIFVLMECKEWFEDWFDTSYYHTLYKNRNDEEASAFIVNLLNYLQLEKKSEVLDLACGKGRHSLTLSKHDFHVLGVDLSANSICEAKKNEHETLRFEVHDMRKVIQGKKFKAIFNLFTSFGYFDNISDNEYVVKSMHEMLEDNGFLIIDFMNSAKVIENLVEEETKEVDGIRFHLERKYDNEHIFKHIRFKVGEEKFHYMERVQALKEKDFVQLLTANKFNIISTFGDFSLKPFNEKTSDRLILIAQKI